MRSFLKRLLHFRFSGNTQWEFDSHIFIVGTTCSGTTLLNKILSKSKGIVSLRREGWDLTDQITNEISLGEPHLFAKNSEVQFSMTCSAIDFGKIKRDWAKHLQNKCGTVFLEKTPSNILRVDYLRANFKNAKFIALVRHPAATVSSIVKRRKSRFGLETDIDEAISQWLNVNKLVLDFSRNYSDFRYWRYEDLAEKSEETLKQIARFGGFELPKEVLALEYQVKGVRSRIKNMNQESISYLSAGQQEYISSKTRSFVESHKLGY